MFNSLQEAFDATVAHLAKQKRRAYKNGSLVQAACSLDQAANGCQYGFITTEGEMLNCAVGCHLPKDNDEYMHFSGTVQCLIDYHLGVREFLDIKPFSDQENFSRTLNFWTELQRAHDCSNLSESPLDCIKYALNKVAYNYSLDPASIETITEWSY